MLSVRRVLLFYRRSGMDFGELLNLANIKSGNVLVVLREKVHPNQKLNQVVQIVLILSIELIELSIIIY